MKTFDELVAQKNRFIGGRIETRESGNQHFEDTIEDLVIEDGIFIVVTAHKPNISTNIEFSGNLYPGNSENKICFRIPYVGSAYLYARKE